ncbi:hypothetical protein ACIPZ5_19550 [Pseudomonas sp. NPDC089428]|uniref:hypothetical protein n=1 Tax=Pseudomonas sp. NPDC089428 TaxID=3364467 RepID=UPI003816DAF4
MLAVELDRFFAKILAAGFFYSMFAAFAAGIMPQVFFVPAIITLLVCVYWSMVCAYRTERFTTYASFRLLTNLFVAPMLAFVLILAVSYKRAKLDPVSAVALSCVPFVIVGFAYVVLRQRPVERQVLEVVGGRVDVLEEASSHSPWMAGVSATVGGLVYSAFRQYDSLYMGVIVLAISISIYMVFYCRHSISSLRALRQQEASEGCQYTFMDIEGVREKRAGSLLGRLFAIKHSQ